MNYLGHPHLQRAALAVRQGRLLAYPTEAVWGLGCDPFDRRACLRLLELKRRPVRKGLILVAADTAQIDFLLADLDPDLRQRLDATWPGPNTWLVPHGRRVPAWVTGEHSTVAVRVSAHPVVRALCLAAGMPLVSTSANPQGAQPARFGFAVRRYFGNSVCYVPGRVDTLARPSTIRDLISGTVIRQ